MITISDQCVCVHMYGVCVCMLSVYVWVCVYVWGRGGSWKLGGYLAWMQKNTAFLQWKTLQKQHSYGTCFSCLLPCMHTLNQNLMKSYRVCIQVAVKFKHTMWRDLSQLLHKQAVKRMGKSWQLFNQHSLNFWCSITLFQASWHRHRPSMDNNELSVLDGWVMSTCWRWDCTNRRIGTLFYFKHYANIFISLHFTIGTLLHLYTANTLHHAQARN